MKKLLFILALFSASPAFAEGSFCPDDAGFSFTDMACSQRDTLTNALDGNAVVFGAISVVSGCIPTPWTRLAGVAFAGAGAVATTFSYYVKNLACTPDKELPPSQREAVIRSVCASLDRPYVNGGCGT